MTRPDPQPRVLAFDEGPFRFGQSTVPVVGVMTRGAHHVEAIVIDRVAVDGWDATDTVVAMTRRLPGAGPDTILIDGIALGGMNLVDLDAVAQATDRPVFGVARRAPDRRGIERAAAQTDRPEDRLAALSKDPPVAVTVRGHTLHIQVAMPHRQSPPPDHSAKEQWDRRVTGSVPPSWLRWFEATTAEGALPEPLRLAHHIATALVQGQSGTRA